MPTTVAFAFGSFGDILATAGLAVQIIKALRDRGESSRNQHLLQELRSLFDLLVSTEEVIRLYEPRPTCQRLVATLKGEVLKCRSLLSDFLSHVNESRRPLDSTNFLRRVAWAMRESEEAASLRTELASRHANLTVQLLLLRSLFIFRVNFDLLKRLLHIIQSHPE